MPSVFLKPMMRIGSDDPAFPDIKEDLELKICADPEMKKRIRFGTNRNGDEYIVITGDVKRDGTVAWPLIVEDDGVQRFWEIGIDILRDTNVLVYTKDGEVARPYFDGEITRRDNSIMRKRAFRLMPGCWVLLFRKDGWIFRLSASVLKETDETGRVIYRFRQHTEPVALLDDLGLVAKHKEQETAEVDVGSEPDDDVATREKWKNWYSNYRGENPPRQKRGHSARRSEVHNGGDD